MPPNSTPTNHELFFDSIDPFRTHLASGCRSQGVIPGGIDLCDPGPGSSRLSDGAIGRAVGRPAGAFDIPSLHRSAGVLLRDVGRTHEQPRFRIAHHGKLRVL